MTKSWFHKDGWILKRIPKKCVNECAASGDAYESVKFWVNKLKFFVPRDLAEKYLKDFGAWDDLQTVDNQTLNERILWLACCDIDEQGEWFGLVH